MSVVWAVAPRPLHASNAVLVVGRMGTWQVVHQFGCVIVGFEKPCDGFGFSNEGWVCGTECRGGDAGSKIDVDLLTSVVVT